jgi:hypothetical protein
MLPSRPTLRSWNPESLATSAASITAGAESVAAAVRGINDACGRMPETEAWSGRSHDAAEAMFGRADSAASKLSEYADGVAAALKAGSETIGRARAALLSKADELDAGPLNVTDQWVVLIDPVRVSAQDMAKLQELAGAEQATINELLTAVGDADEETAKAVAAAGSQFGYEESEELTGPFAIPGGARPQDEVPNPKELPGMMTQETIRAADQQQNVREVIESTNQYGEEVTTVIKQDGSKAVTTRMDPFEWASKENFYEMEEFDKDGNFVARTSSWHDMYNDCDYTSITYADLSNLTISMDPTGYRTAGFTPAGGRSTQVPVELIDNISLVTGSGLSGLEKHIVNGGSLPMLTAESVENVGKASKFGGPALEVATTVFDMAMADSDKERCIALLSGIGGAGGGWAGAEAGAAVGALPVPIAFLTVPAGAFAGSLLVGFGGAKMGEFIGEVVCPY